MSTFKLTLAEILNPNNLLTLETWKYAIEVSARYSIRLRVQPHIRALVPFATAAEPWWPEVTHGRIVATFPQQDNSNIQVVYEVPEYWQQPFVKDDALGISYDQGVLAVRGEEVRILGRRTVATQRRPLHVVVETALTSPDFGMPKRNASNVACLRVYRAGSSQDLPIADWHAPSGEITLDQDIDFTDDIRADYLYRPQGVVYRGFSPDGSAFYRLDLNPLPGHTYHDPSNGTLHDSSELLTKAVYLYLLPSKVGDTTTYPPPRLRHWVADRSLAEEDVVAQIRASYTGQGQEYLLLLARILVRMPYSPWHVQLIDTRRRGGGLLSSLDSGRLSASYPSSEIDQFWDIGRWDGPPYPDHGVFVLRTPAAWPGALSRERLVAAEQAVQGYRACGTLGVVFEDSSMWGHTASLPGVGAAYNARP